MEPPLTLCYPAFGCISNLIYRSLVIDGMEGRNIILAEFHLTVRCSMPLCLLYIFTEEPEKQEENDDMKGLSRKEKKKLKKKVGVSYLLELIME